MNRMKKRACLALLCCLLAAMTGLLSGCGQQTEPAVSLTPTDRFFVNDYADVLSGQAEEAMYAQGVQLQEKTGAQVVAVTVDSLDGEPLEDYSFELARAWGIGEKDKDTGVLLLLAVEERQVRIEVGSGLEGALPDGKTGRILDHYAIPSLRKNDFSTGMQRAYDAVVNEVYLEFGLEPEEGYVPADQLPAAGEDEGFPLAGLVGIVLVVLLLAVLGPRLPFFAYFGGFGRGGRGGFGGFGGGGFSGGGGGFSGGGGGFSGGGSSRGF